MTENPFPPAPATSTDEPLLHGEAERPQPVAQPPGEIGGPRGPEPTRFGDWECKGRCSDF
ncbi:MAG: succinate dehydrogenase assembly factor 4 [Rhodospirillaceae bacterium]